MSIKNHTRNNKYTLQITKRLCVCVYTINMYTNSTLVFSTSRINNIIIFLRGT